LSWYRVCSEPLFLPVPFFSFYFFIFTQFRSGQLYLIYLFLLGLQSSWSPFLCPPPEVSQFAGEVLSTGIDSLRRFFFSLVWAPCALTMLTDCFQPPSGTFAACFDFFWVLSFSHGLAKAVFGSGLFFFLKVLFPPRRFFPTHPDFELPSVYGRHRSCSMRLARQADLC